MPTSSDPTTGVYSLKHIGLIFVGGELQQPLGEPVPKAQQVVSLFAFLWAQEEEVWVQEEVWVAILWAQVQICVYVVLHDHPAD